jgi:DNA helicase-4
MNNLELKRSWLAQLFFGRQDAVLAHQPTGLRVADDAKKQLLPFARMYAQPEVRHGLFWSDLYITTARKTYLYRGFSRSRLCRLAALLNQGLQNHVEQQLQTEYANAGAIKSELRAFLDSSVYRRDSERRAMVHRCQQLSLTTAPLRERFATSRQKLLFKPLATFIAASEDKVKKANARFVRQEEIRFKSFFDTIEKNPLTIAQRRACVINEDCNLVLAGAGTGKTSTMIGRAGYLLASEQTRPEQILMLAFAKKAAEEMQERQDKCLRPMLQQATPTIKTFHALGLEIIGTVEGKWPAISLLAEDNAALIRFVEEVISRLMQDAVYKRQVELFCGSPLYPKSMAEFTQLLAEFLMLFKQSYLTLAELTAQLAKPKNEKQRFSLLTTLFEPVLVAYQQHLSERNEIDFADMIGKAIEYIESGHYRSPYQHILVDEFQDISQPRARLINALLDQRDDAVLFAVGDDWQAIYRFSGSDLSVTQRFSDMFGVSSVTALDTTFRFNNKIGDVASTFVLQNPAQIKKSISSVAVVTEPAVSLIQVKEAKRGLHQALNAIHQLAMNQPEKKTSVAVLARFNFLLGDGSPKELKLQMETQYPLLDLQFMSVHASKGKEADYVIVLGMNNGKYGFPSQKKSDPILEFLLPKKEQFPEAEERRLFYVALTRAKHRVYLAYNPTAISPFIAELIDQKYPVCTDEFTEI